MSTSNQDNQSNLLIELTVEEQELQTGGQFFGGYGGYYGRGLYGGFYGRGLYDPGFYGGYY